MNSIWQFSPRTPPLFNEQHSHGHSEHTTILLCMVLFVLCTFSFCGKIEFSFSSLSLTHSPFPLVVIMIIIITISLPQWLVSLSLCCCSTTANTTTSSGRQSNLEPKRKKKKKKREKCEVDGSFIYISLACFFFGGTFNPYLVRAVYLNLQITPSSSSSSNSVYILWWVGIYTHPRMHEWNGIYREGNKSVHDNNNICAAHTINCHPRRFDFPHALWNTAKKRVEWRRRRRLWKLNAAMMLVKCECCGAVEKGKERRRSEKLFHFYNGKTRCEMNVKGWNMTEWDALKKLENIFCETEISLRIIIKTFSN